MIGIAFALSFAFAARKKWQKVLLAALAGLQFFTMSLTNCRTIILVTSALLGGILCLIIAGNSWKRFLIGVMAALCVIVAGFRISGEIYEWHTENLKEKIAAQLQEQKEGSQKEETKKEESKKEETKKEETKKEESKKEETKKEETKKEETKKEETKKEETKKEETKKEETKKEGSKKETKSGEAEPEKSAEAPKETVPEIREKYKVNKKTGEIQLISDNKQKSFMENLDTLNGRTEIWKACIKELRDNTKIMLFGTEDVGFLISRNTYSDFVHAHNSWMETWMRLGLPGLLIALAYTWLALRCVWVLFWSKQVELAKKVLVILVACLLVAGFLEPYLFMTNVYYHTVDFIFFFCLGYLDYWRGQLSGKYADL